MCLTFMFFIVFNAFATTNTLVCGRNCEYTNLISMQYQRNISSTFPDNSEATGSELLGNNEERFPPY